MAAYAALVSLMHIINNLQSHPRPPISLHTTQAESLIKKVGFLLEFLEVYQTPIPYSREADPLESGIANAAYSAEYAIESHIFDQLTNNGENMSFGRLYEALEMEIQDMASIEVTIQRGVQQRRNSRPPDSSTSSSILQHPDSSTSSSIPQQISMVGADDVKFQIMDKLTSPNGDDLQIIPIVGMGGSGKTTLARTVYEERLIKEHFDICAWADVSQEYSIREIFVVILRQFNIRVKDNEHELGDKLHRHLYDRRYLMLRAWDSVERYFPNKKGSRIVVTTRLTGLASRLANSNSIQMKLLDENDSWDLLSKTVFGKGSCPLDLEEIGKKIGKNCKGLPLSIVVVGGLLAKSEQTREFWEYIGENLNAVVNLKDDECCLKILYMSYQELPTHLKPCFLYMGVFREDELISISKLIKVWNAEGFIKPVGEKSLEEIAKENLKDLIARNLIMSHKMGITGNMKYRKIHDLLRDLCLREAQKEEFYIITSNKKAIRALPSTSQGRCWTWNVQQELTVPSMRLMRIVETRRFHLAEDFFENVDRLVNSRYLEIFTLVESDFPSIWRFWNLQTLIVYNGNEVTAPTDFWYMAHTNHVKFYRLRLPDPPNDQDDIVLGNLQRLGNVYGFKCSEQVVRKIPNIKKLVFHNGGNLDDDMYIEGNLDDDMYNEGNLDDDMYIEGNLDDDTYNLDDDMYNEGNLDDDMYIEGNLDDDTYNLDDDMYNERNLDDDMYIEGNLDDDMYNEGNLDDDMYYLSNLAGLTKLESLDCTFSHAISFPHSLKRLVLRGTKLGYWEVLLDKIGVLPHLEKLKLDWGRFNKEKWETTEGQFRSLKSLNLYGCLDLKTWIAESSHFPCLEQLHLHELHELKEIPSDFEYSLLREIVVQHCSDSTVVS